MSFESVLIEYNKQKKLLESESWYHECLSRDAAESRIRRNGEFLVRESTRSNHEFVLTTKWNGQHVHMIVLKRISSDGTSALKVNYTFGEHEQPSVIQLIRFHWINQVPMSRSSEAIICRPVHLINPVITTSPSWNPKYNRRKLAAVQMDGPKTRLKLAGLAGSVSDLTSGMEPAGTRELPRKGSSVHDLRGDPTYVEPELLSNCPQLHSGLRNSDLTTSDSKYSSINRKAIRYVEMFNAPNLSAQTSGKCPSNFLHQPDKNVPADTYSQEPIGCINYDFTVPLYAGLTSHIGSVTRALEKTAWTQLSALYAQRAFTPFVYAGHLTTETIRLLNYPLPTQLSRSETDSIGLTIFHSSATTLREDVVIRDRFLRLFILASILFGDSQKSRLKVVTFWLEVAQCLCTIYRDYQSLVSVSGALISPQAVYLKRLWRRLELDPPSCIKQITLKELLSHHENRCTNSEVSERVSALKKLEWRTQIPNLMPWLVDEPIWAQNTSSSAFSANMDSDLLESQKNSSRFRIDCSWLRELQSSSEEQDPLLSCLVRTETMITMLIGPFKLERGPTVNALADKLDQVLMEIAKLAESA
ncbi:uncharacterized protein DEA37_0009395 [Paragonimus westermani]|uniref:SH2 domain-containing protein n=1 Tax=Paragonimus westermani TaxID=34504 RepID=A0A5J4N988_9TREM|nr:uncharacterized protein DEA37_0009395 [Paragonimus westermani]